MVKRKLNINKAALTVIILNIIQITLIAAIVIYSSTAFHKAVLSIRFTNIDILLVLIMFIVILNSFFAIRSRYDIIKADTQYSMLKNTLSQLEDLNKTLRSQRHDFLNHLQVVYSLMELEEYKDAREYIDKVYGDIQKVSNVLRTSLPAVNALLQAKLLSCDKRAIVLDLDISTKLDRLPVPSWEFCRILGNLIDNSIDALSGISTNKHIGVSLFETSDSYMLEINNSGPAIPSDILDKIFEAGFTTKGVKGEGMGLAIVKEILDAYRGTVTVSSDEKLTEFKVVISKGF